MGGHEQQRGSWLTGGWLRLPGSDPSDASDGSGGGGGGSLHPGGAGRGTGPFGLGGSHGTSGAPFAGQGRTIGALLADCSPDCIRNLLLGRTASPWPESNLTRHKKAISTKLCCAVMSEGNLAAVPNDRRQLFSSFHLLFSSFFSSLFLSVFFFLSVAEGASERTLPAGVPAYAANAGLSSAPVQPPPMYPVGPNIAGGAGFGGAAGARYYIRHLLMPVQQQPWCQS